MGKGNGTKDDAQHDAWANEGGAPPAGLPGGGAGAGGQGGTGAPRDAGAAASPAAQAKGPEDEEDEDDDYPDIAQLKPRISHLEAWRFACSITLHAMNGTVLAGLAAADREFERVALFGALYDYARQRGFDLPAETYYRFARTLAKDLPPWGGHDPYVEMGLVVFVNVASGLARLVDSQEAKWTEAKAVIAGERAAAARRQKLVSNREYEKTLPQRRKEAFERSQAQDAINQADERKAEAARERDKRRQERAAGDGEPARRLKHEEAVAEGVKGAHTDRDLRRQQREEAAAGGKAIDPLKRRGKGAR